MNEAEDRSKRLSFKTSRVIEGIAELKTHSCLPSVHCYSFFAREAQFFLGVADDTDVWTPTVSMTS